MLLQITFGHGTLCLVVKCVYGRYIVLEPVVGAHWGIHMHKVIGIYVLITPTSCAILTGRNILKKYLVTLKKYTCNSWNITQKWIVEKWHEIDIGTSTPLLRQRSKLQARHFMAMGHSIWSLRFFWGVFGKIYKFLRGVLCRHFDLFS